MSAKDPYARNDFPATVHDKECRLFTRTGYVQLIIDNKAVFFTVGRLEAIAKKAREQTDSLRAKRQARKLVAGKSEPVESPNP